MTKARLVAGIAVGGIAIIFLAISIWLQGVYLTLRDQFFQERSKNIETVRKLGSDVSESQIFSMASAVAGVFFGAISAGLVASFSKNIGGAMILALGLFVLYGYIADPALCLLD